MKTRPTELPSSQDLEFEMFLASTRPGPEPVPNVIPKDTRPMRKKKQNDTERLSDILDTLDDHRDVPGPSNADLRRQVDAGLGRLVMSYPLELALVTDRAYDRTIEVIMGETCYAYGTDEIDGGHRKLTWLGHSSFSVRPLDAMFKEYGITNVRVEFHSPMKESAHV